MRITVNETGRREYYDEVLYVASNYKRFQKKVLLLKMLHLE